MWGHTSFGGPIYFPYGAFLMGPALHELQGGTWKWGYKFQEAQTCESGLTVYKLDSESHEWEKMCFPLLMHRGWAFFSQGVVENRKFSLMGRTLIDITDILWNYLNYLWWQNHCLYCTHKMKARKEIWSTVVPIRHNCHLFLGIFLKLKPTSSLYLSYIYISPCMAQWTN